MSECLDSLCESTYLSLWIEIQKFRMENHNGILDVTEIAIILNVSLSSKFQIWGFTNILKSSTFCKILMTTT